MYMLYDTILMAIYTHVCTHMHTNVHTRFLNHPHMGKRVKTQFSSSLKALALNLCSVYWLLSIFLSFL